MHGFPYIHQKTSIRTFVYVQTRVALPPLVCVCACIIIVYHIRIYMYIIVYTYICDYNADQCSAFRCARQWQRNDQ